ncbi:MULTISPECIES: hypothetical protein [unclassified Neptuniibacter]|uniref:hypothetical protein n=1 Tax=unclassified Neptuniibacter TaxID=2630693 RepID=UPI000C5BBBC6|nr:MULTISPECIES: hypothetical protein [unclassified Neptuniibacter]MAY42297.1 hypothetical protein [Oceanospirillaceae bacterium]
MKTNKTLPGVYSGLSWENGQRTHQGSADMSPHIQGLGRSQVTLFPEVLDDFIFPYKAYRFAVDKLGANLALPESKSLK